VKFCHGGGQKKGRSNQGGGGEKPGNPDTKGSVRKRRESPKKEKKINCQNGTAETNTQKGMISERKNGWRKLAEALSTPYIKDSLLKGNERGVVL